ncbi:hypothetical protein AALG83_07055 [Christensenellaceae bacterium 44-20]
MPPFGFSIVFPKRGKIFQASKKASGIAQNGNLQEAFFAKFISGPCGAPLHLCANFAFMHKSYQHYQQHMHKKA